MKIIESIYSTVLKAIWIYTYEVLVMTFHILRRLEGRKPSRTVVSSLTLLAILVTGSLIGCTRDPAARAKKHMDKAEAYAKANKMDEAAIELRRAIQENPRSADAHFRLAQISFAKGDANTGAQEIGLTLKNNAEHHEANVIAAELMLMAGSFGPAKTKAQFIMDKWPADARGATLLAESEAGMGDLTSATQVINERLAKDPNDSRALFDRAKIELTQGKTADAERTTRRVLELLPNAVPAHALLALIQERQGHLDEAEATYKDAVAKNPKNIQAHVSLLSFYVKQKRLDAAEQEARAIKDLGGKPARPLLARFYIMTNRAPEAEKEFKSLIAQGDPDNSITRELAVLYLNEGRYDEGRQLVDKILKDTPHNAVALMLRGRLELADQKVEPAVEDLQNAIKSDPDLAQAYLYLSEGLQRLGKTQEAEAALSDALRRDPKNRPARMALAQQELRLGENDQAVSDLEKVMSSSQNDMSAQLLMAQAMANKQEYADADKRMAELLAQAQQPNARALIYRTWAQMKLKEKKPQDARKYASSALDLEPRNLANFAALAFAYIQANQGPAGLQDLKRRVEKYPDWAEGYEWLGVMAIKVNDLNAANQWFEKALQLDPKNVRYQRSLAEMYGVEGKMDQAKAAYEAIIAQHPDDAPSLFRAAQLNEQSGNWPRAEALYKHCIELNPKDAASKNNLAYGYLTHNGNVDVALKLAQEAKEQMPSDPTIDDTVAWAYIQKGSYTAAVEFLKQALEKSPNQPTFNYHLGYAYMKSGNSSEAKKAFESALKTPAFVSTKDGADAKQYLATLH